MSLSTSLRTYLGRQRVSFDEVPHSPAMCASTAAQAAHVSGDCVAKGVLLRTNDGFMLAVVPASHHIRFSDLRKWLGHEVGLATEQDIQKVFTDCDLGAIPPFGEAYGVETIMDDSLLAAEDVYFEAGDHRTLVHLGGEEWRRLMKKTPHTVFSA